MKQNDLLPAGPASRPATPGTRRPAVPAVTPILALLALAILPAAAQNVTQSFALRPGWNSVWLDVAPTNPATASVFAGAPLAGVWTFASRNSSVEFIEQPDEPVWNRDRWLRFVPTNHPGAFQNNLFSLPAARAYLVQVTNSFTWTVTGRPVWRPRPWVPDAYNLRGFPVDPDARPSFAEFFRHSPAHYDATTGRLQKMYRLAATGQWTPVQAGDLIAPGEAYWVFSRGGSDYVAPVSVQLDAGDRIDFGASLEASTLTFRNHRSGVVTLTVRDTAGTTPLTYRRFNGSNGNEWISLANPATQPVANSNATPLTLAIRRGAMAGATFESVLNITDAQGTRIRLGVTAQRTAGNGAGGGGGAGFAAGGSSSCAGLWMGNAVINTVNEVNNATNNSSPTASPEFNLRLLIHVDANGTARLLKEVTQMWQDGVTTNNAAGQAVTQTPGRFVLVTEEALFANFKGATIRDGTQAGRRLSAIGYDFPTAPGANYLPLDGTFATDGTLAGIISLAPEFATNPFRHKYHPDHDNLDARFANFKAEAHAIQRSVSLEFTNLPPAGLNAADYGYGMMAGTYRESVTGLNRQPIQCAGPFVLTRVSQTPVLNQ